MSTHVFEHPNVQATPGTPGQTLLDVLRRNAARMPDEQVYQFIGNDGEEEGALSHAALAALVSRYARAIVQLTPHSVTGPARVVLVLPQGRHFVAAFFGCIAAQAIAVPTFPPKNPRQAERLKLVLMDLKDCLVLADRESLHTDLAQLRRDPDLARVQWAAVEEAAQENASSLADFRAEPDAIAMLQYTSGSTGQPRGVMVSNRNLLENSELIKQCFAHQRPNRRSVIWLPPYHDMGLIGGVIQPVHAGYPALLMPTSLFVRHPDRWLKAIDSFRGTSSGGPNFAFQMCVNHVRERDLRRLDLSSWDIAFCGAEPIHHRTLRDFCKRFSVAGFRPSALYPCYGMAETTLMVSGKHPLEDFRTLTANSRALTQGVVAEQPAGAPGSHTLVSCGEVHPSLDVRIVEPSLHTERAAREIGEIWVSGPSVTQGYWGQGEKTRQTFGQQLPGRNGHYLRTGDLGFFDGDQLYVTGRIKEVLIVRGANHYPQDLEQECLLACPEVLHLRAAAFSLPDTAHEKVVLALEVPRTDIDHADMVRRINTRWTDKFGIRANTVLFVPRHTLRTTTSGKLQRLGLRSEYLEDRLPTYHVWEEQAAAADSAAQDATPCSFDASSLDSIQHWIVHHIAAATQQRPEQIGRQQRFTELALDSVTSLGILSDLENRHGIGVAPESLYKHNTPELLAMHIHAMARQAHACLLEGATHATS